MTEETVTPEAQAPETDDAPEPEIEEQPIGKGNREAAKYRRQLRDAEAERDSLKVSIAQARGKILEQTLDQRFYSVLKLSGRDLNTLFTEDGDLDEDALQTAGDELDKEYPGMIEQQRGEWHGLHEAPPLQLLKSNRRGAAAPNDPDEGKSPNRPLNEDSWKGAFVPKK